MVGLVDGSTDGSWSCGWLDRWYFWYKDCGDRVRELCKTMSSNCVIDLLDGLLGLVSSRCCQHKFADDAGLVLCAIGLW